MEKLKNEAIEEIMYVNDCDEEEAENTFEDLMYLMGISED